MNHRSVDHASLDPMMASRVPDIDQETILSLLPLGFFDVLFSVALGTIGTIILVEE